jgi:hypothetical protein
MMFRSLGSGMMHVTASSETTEKLTKIANSLKKGNSCRKCFTVSIEYYKYRNRMNKFFLEIRE